jgi:nanoRNase/pAp phosphatase (c-di-AMP/oligoRNAs hydrolase)
MKMLPDLLRSHTIDEILIMPDFKERITVYHQETEVYRTFIHDHAKIAGHVILLDLRDITEVPSGNRFIEYTLFPLQNISVRLVRIKSTGMVMISVGHSIINQTSTVDVGSLMLRYGGGGHHKVGTCQVKEDQADEVLKIILAEINR